MSKNLFFKNSMIALALCSVSFAFAKSETLKVDTAATVLDWKGAKVTGTHNGKIKLSEGQLTLNENQIAGGKFVIDMNSMTCEDITDAETNQKLMGHMKSEDFFEVSKFPTSTFEIAKVTALKAPDAAGNTHTIEGKLTIKGNSNPYSFPAKVELSKGVVKAMGTMKIDRTKWNVRYGSGKFFKGLGDKAIHDEFEIALNLTAKK